MYKMFNIPIWLRIVNIACIVCSVILGLLSLQVDTTGLTHVISIVLLFVCLVLDNIWLCTDMFDRKEKHVK